MSAKKYLATWVSDHVTAASGEKNRTFGIDGEVKSLKFMLFFVVWIIGFQGCKPVHLYHA